jgi:hypothetical protein
MVAICIIIIIISGVGLSPLGTAATSGLIYKPQMTEEGDCGAIGGMKIGMGNRSTRRKLAICNYKHSPNYQLYKQYGTRV